MDKYTIGKKLLKQDGEKLIREALLPKIWSPMDVDADENLIELENTDTGCRLWCPIHELFKMPISIGRTVGIVDYESITNISQKASATTYWVFEKLDFREFRNRTYLQAVFIPE